MTLLTAYYTHTNSKNSKNKYKDKNTEINKQYQINTVNNAKILTIIIVIEAHLFQGKGIKYNKNLNKQELKNKN